MMAQLNTFASILEAARTYEQTYDLPPLSVIDFLEQLLDDGWTFVRRDVT